MSETDYSKGRKAIEALAPLVSEHGGGKEFAVLVDMVDALKPKDEPQSTVPWALTGKYAKSAFIALQIRFRKAVGINVFDTQTEEIVRATWSLVTAIIADKYAELEDLYTNSGTGSTPDWDAVTDLMERTEIPEDLHALLLGVTPKARETRRGR